jgi:hypothetical protein
MRREDYDWDDEEEWEYGEYEPPPPRSDLPQWRAIELGYWVAIAVFFLWLLSEAAHHPALAHLLTTWP